MRNIFRKWISGILVMLLILGNVAYTGAFSSYAAIEESEIAKIIGEQKGPYDVMIRLDYFGADKDALSRKEKAERAQKELLAYLSEEKENGNVEKYEAFYIANGVHAVVEKAEVLYEIAKQENVIAVTPNQKIKLIRPVEEDKKSRKKREIFEPDERRIEWGVSMVHGDKVWEEYQITGKGVTVGIIDTGVNYKLPAIKNNYKGYDETSGKFDKSYYKDFVDGLPEPMADHVNDHGTHVAGTIIGAEGENLNRIGVAPGAKFISARAINDQGGETSNLLAAAEWMLEQKPDVINNSWGGDSDDNRWFYDIAEAWKEAGIVGVFAAGNQSGREGVPGLGTVANPGNMLNVLTVGAVDINKKLGTFSKKGPSAFDDTKKIIKPELVAPGVQVRSLDATGNYVSWNGTSMATPHVVGVIALLREADPNLSVEEIISLLESTAEPLSDAQYKGSPNMAYGYGLVNAYDAISKIKGKAIGKIYGKVLKEGQDHTAATGEAESEKEAYLGRDYRVSALLKDDVSIREAKAYFSFNDETEEQSIALNLQSGVQNDGIYTGEIQAELLKEGVLHLRIAATDFAGNVTEIRQAVSVHPGASLPWDFDFEKDLSGFLLKGNWALSKRESSKEPTLPDGSTQYIGIDGGSPIFTASVESSLELPPMDFSAFSKGDNLCLTADVYNSFQGICRAEIQARLASEKEWKTVYQTVLRPDITERSWERNSYSLAEYAGAGEPVLLRFYFLGRGEGAGWYLDNLHIGLGDTLPPKKVEGLKAEMEERGIRLRFTMNEETDMKEYAIEKKASGEEEFREIAILPQGFKKKFIDEKGVKTHYEMSYLDEDVLEGESYSYRIIARDLSGNESESSKTLKVKYGSLRSNVSYNFDDEDGGFQPETLQYNINDWEHGKIALPADWMEKTLLYRNVYEGLMVNQTGVWGTVLNGPMSHGFTVKQDAVLLMPSFTVEKGDYFYFDSFSVRSNIDQNISFTVEIQKEGEDSFATLFSKEKIQGFSAPQQWHTLSQSLDSYIGETVQVRFRVQADGGLRDEYNVGWYIDNVYVGEKKNSTENSNIATNTTITELEKDEIDAASASDSAGFSAENEGLSASDEEENSIDKVEAEHNKKELQGIPLEAKIAVLESGKYTMASVLDGSYSLEHAVNNPEEPFTVEVSAYGYETEVKKIDLSKNPVQEYNFLLKEKKRSEIRGKVLDKDGHSLKGVSLRLLEDSRLPRTETNEEGTFLIQHAYTGAYTLKAYKKGYLPKEISVQLGEEALELPDIVLDEEAKDGKEAETDYGFQVEEKNGAYDTIHFVNGMKGSAVRFQAPFKGAVLKSAKLFLVNNSYYNGNHIEIGVLGYDTEKRLRELAPFRDYGNYSKNAWNEIDLSEYQIKRNEPLYIATSYKTALSDSLGLYYDVNAKEDAKKRSYVYDGAFTETSALQGVGAFAIKASWTYPEGAEKNPETEVDDSSNNTGGDIHPIVEEDFDFDDATQTIIKYNGKNPEVLIPKTIRGVAVKHIGEGAFNKINQEYETKIKSLIVPEGVETIGKDAFKNNRLEKVRLPESLREIGEGAFQFQYKDSGTDKTDFTINLPRGVKVIHKNTFSSAGSPLVVTSAERLEKMEKDAFSYNKEVEIHADKLQEIEEGAFGVDKRAVFSYAKVFTKEDSTLQSKDGEYLINPTFVNLTAIDAKDSEKVLRRSVVYGPGNSTGFGRNQDAKAFYRIGETVRIEAEDFKKGGQDYTSVEEAKEMTLGKQNSLSFQYYLLSMQLRLPILDSDRNLPGFTLPSGKVKLIQEKNEGGTVTQDEVKANEDGFFVLPLPALSEGDKIILSVNGKKPSEYVVEKTPNKKYVVEKGKLLRYLGEEKALQIPTSFSTAGDITEIGDFAFYEKSLDTVEIPVKVNTIGAGAFMNSGLHSFSFAAENVNLAALRIIKEYAFKNNKLQSIEALPELTHVIQKKAFENNALEKLVLSKYLGHVGEAAFKNNKIKTISIPGNIEELGREAFMNNELSSVQFLEPQNAKEDMEGVSHLEEAVFANNAIKEVELGKSIKTVDDTAFLGNRGGLPTLKTDAEGITATKTYDVLRSDGTLLSLEKKEDSEGKKEDSQKEERKDSKDKPSGTAGRPSRGSGIAGRSSNASGSSGGNGKVPQVLGATKDLSEASSIDTLPKNYQGEVKLLYGKRVPSQVVDPIWVMNFKNHRYMLVNQEGGFYRNAWVLVFRNSVTEKTNGLPYAWYHFDENGMMQTGWFEEAGNRYYFSEEDGADIGVMLTKNQEIHGKNYSFEASFGSQMGQLLSGG